MKSRLCSGTRVRLNRCTLCLVVISLTALHLCGLDTYLYQANYFAEFAYPLQVNISKLTIQLKRGLAPDVPPVYHFPYSLLLDSSHVCAGHPRVDLLVVVKSRVGNFENRRALRDTWLSLAANNKSVVRRVFLVAAATPDHPTAALHREQLDNGDLVQGSFLDGYYNNTPKTIMGFRWVQQHCAHAEFILFVDDDYYVSLDHVLALTRGRNGDRPWYTGHLFFVLPVRIPFHRFFVSLAEYPYNVFPPFINGGAYLVSRETLVSFYYATLYTRPFILDDVFVGILAKKTNVSPEHNRHFFPFRVPYSEHQYADLVACHGYRNPWDLRNVWRKKLASETRRAEYGKSRDAVAI